MPVARFAPHAYFTRNTWSCALVMALVACGDPVQGTCPEGLVEFDGRCVNSTTPNACLEGSVTYGVRENDQIAFFRTTLGSMLSTDNLDEAFDALAEGDNRWVASSPDGRWLLTESEQFDSTCEGWACLAIVRADLSAAETVRIAGEAIHPAAYSAIASGGDRIVYVLASDEGQGLFVTNREGAGWSVGQELTMDSPFAFNAQPALSTDGETVLFDCGESMYSQPPTSICEVGTDGTGFRVVWAPERGGVGVEGRPNAALHHADYAPDGSIIFEADWNGQRLWRLEGEGPPIVLSGQNNDSAPCVLPNGCIVSLWSERRGGDGRAELKIMDSSGGHTAMIRTDVEILSTGISCGP